MTSLTPLPSFCFFHIFSRSASTWSWLSTTLRRTSIHDALLPKPKKKFMSTRDSTSTLNDDTRSCGSLTRHFDNRTFFSSAGQNANILSPNTQRSELSISGSSEPAQQPSNRRDRAQTSRLCGARTFPPTTPSTLNVVTYPKFIPIE